MNVKCPQCGTSVIWDSSNPHRPFCSKRCKLIDLGEWASENRYIPGEPAQIPESEGDFVDPTDTSESQT